MRAMWVITHISDGATATLLPPARPPTSGVGREMIRDGTKNFLKKKKWMECNKMSARPGSGRERTAEEAKAFNYTPSSSFLFFFFFHFDLLYEKKQQKTTAAKAVREWIERDTTTTPFLVLSSDNTEE